MEANSDQNLTYRSALVPILLLTVAPAPSDCSRARTDCTTEREILAAVVPVDIVKAVAVVETVSHGSGVDERVVLQ